MDEAKQKMPEVSLVARSEESGQRQVATEGHRSAESKVDVERPRHAGSLAKYDSKFQELVLSVLLHDREWAQEISDVFSPEMFEEEHLVYVAKRYWAFYKKYSAFPSLGVFISDLKLALPELNDVLRGRITSLLLKISASPATADAAFAKEKVQQFCRRQTMKEAVVKIVDLIQNDQIDEVFTVMSKAVTSSSPASHGHDFHKEREARWDDIARSPISTGIQELDKALNGGLSGGELGVVVAPTGVGKSHFLVSCGASALMQGKNVIHYTLELSAHLTGRRYDSNLVGVDCNDVPFRKDELAAWYDSQKGLGKLFIKAYPTGGASVVSFRTHIERLGATGFTPDMIVVDYGDIMKSAANVEGERFKQKAVYEELRALAMELNIPLWTASQSNKDGASSDIVTAENMGESYGKAQVADLIVSISRKAAEKASGAARLFVAKSRLGGDGMVWPLQIDTAQSRFLVCEDTLTMAQVEHENEEARKELGKSVMSKVNKQWRAARGALNSLDRIDMGE